MSTYIFGAIRPESGAVAGLVLPWCNTEAMSLHLAEIAARVRPGRHCALLLDQAGWHLSDRLAVPPNITIVPLPASGEGAATADCGRCALDGAVCGRNEDGLGDIFRSSHAVGGVAAVGESAGDRRAYADRRGLDDDAPSVEVEFHEVLLKRRATLAYARDRQLSRTAGDCRSVRKFAHGWCEFEPEALLLLIAAAASTRSLPNSCRCAGTE